MTETLATVEGVMSIAFELARIREEHGAQSGMYLSEVRALRAEVERLAAQSAPTGLTDMGWVIDAATKGELAAYDQGIAESIQAVTKILDGKDAGAGIANRPWEPLRRRLLALVAQSAPLAQQAREYPPLDQYDAAAHMYPSDLETFKTGEHAISAFSIPVGSPTHGKSEPLWTTAQMRAYVDADRAAAQVEPSAPPAPGGDVQALRDALQSIKSLVVGDKHPRWADDTATYLTRCRVADIADAALQSAQGQDAAPAEQPQDDEPTWQELEDFRKRHWTHWNAADNLLIAHLAQKLKCAARAKE